MSREFFHTLFLGNDGRIGLSVDIKRNWYIPLPKAAGLRIDTFTMLRRERARFVLGAAP